MLLGDLRDGSLVRLPKDRHHLLFRKSNLLHGSLVGPRAPFSQASGGPKNATQVNGAAVLEFDDAAGLQAYLEHLAHQQLASQFFKAFEQALMYDFDLQEGEAGLAALLLP